ncbi:MAG: primosomal protein N', partial [Cyanobium sp.]
ATAATALTERIRPELERAGWVAIGPGPAPVGKGVGHTHWQVLLHGPASGGPAGGGAASGGAAAMVLPLPPEAELRQLLPAGVSLAIDPDPLQL